MKLPRLTYPQALRLISDVGTRDAIREALLAWHSDADPARAVGRVIVPNVQARECFLKPSRMKKILLAVHAAASKSAKAVPDAYENACNDHVLCGGALVPNPTASAPSAVGRAVDRSRFYEFLENYYGLATTKPLPFFPFFGGASEIESFIDDLLAGTLKPVAAQLLLASHSVWVTWRDDVSAGPFTWLKQGIADEVRAGLGLNPQFGDSILLMEYAPTDVSLQRPTIADAGLFEYFEPPSRDHYCYGRTRPWTAGFARTRKTPIVEAPVSRPEAVHERNEAQTLVLPIGLVN
jgi:hypothetical protein